MIMKKLTVIAGKIAILALMGAGMLSSCDDRESYTKLLRDEEKACNWYLSNETICLEIPADGNFKMGEDAPFYKMNPDGTLYMQVINPGDPSDRAQTDDLVYFRYMACNVKSLYEVRDDKTFDTSVLWVGNAGNQLTSTPRSFRYDNKTQASISSWGSGIEVPLDYFGYGAEVNLLLKGSVGFTECQTQCIPYIMNVKYFKPEY